MDTIYRDGSYYIERRDDDTFWVGDGERDARLSAAPSRPIHPGQAESMRKAGMDPSRYVAVPGGQVIRAEAASAWDAAIDRYEQELRQAKAWRAEYDRLQAEAERAEDASYHDPSRIIAAKARVRDYLAAHPDVAERLAAERGPRQMDWAYSEDAVQRALRLED